MRHTYNRFKIRTNLKQHTELVVVMLIDELDRFHSVLSNL